MCLFCAPSTEIEVERRHSNTFNPTVGFSAQDMLDFVLAGLKHLRIRARSYLERTLDYFLRISYPFEGGFVYCWGKK